jgi:hypothetical protein
MRWRLAIQDFNFSVAYIKGENNNVADALSRCVPSSSSLLPPGQLTTSLPSSTATERPTMLHHLSGQSTDPLHPIPFISHQFTDFIQQEHRTHYFIPKGGVNTFLNLIDDQPNDTD